MPVEKNVVLGIVTGTFLGTVLYRSTKDVWLSKASSEAGIVSKDVANSRAVEIEKGVGR